MKEDYFTISVKDIQKQYEEKTSQRIIIYKKLLERCFLYIKNCAYKDETKCFFKVPIFKWGLPIYKMNQCIEFIMMKLKQKGFKCNQIKKTNTIYISWTLRKPNMKLLEYRPVEEAPKPITQRRPKEIELMPMRKEPPKKQPDKSVYQYRPSGYKLY